MTTIVVRMTLCCEACGQGGRVDDKRTGENAAKWRRAVNVSQRSIAVDGMGIKQSFYSALELGKRHWTSVLVNKFEAAMLPLLQDRDVEPSSL